MRCAGPFSRLYREKGTHLTGISAQDRAGALTPSPLSLPLRDAPQILWEQHFSARPGAPKFPASGLTAPLCPAQLGCCCVLLTLPSCAMYYMHVVLYNILCKMSTAFLQNPQISLPDKCEHPGRPLPQHSPRRYCTGQRAVRSNCNRLQRVFIVQHSLKTFQSFLKKSTNRPDVSVLLHVKSTRGRHQPTPCRSPPSARKQGLLCQTENASVCAAGAVHLHPVLYPDDTHPGVGHSVHLHGTVGAMPNSAEQSPGSV